MIYATSAVVDVVLTLFCFTLCMVSDFNTNFSISKPSYCRLLPFDAPKTMYLLAQFPPSLSVLTNRLIRQKIQEETSFLRDGFGVDQTTCITKLQWWRMKRLDPKYPQLRKRELEKHDTG